MEPNIDTLKRSRRVYRTQLVKKINELDAELAREDPDRTVVQVKLEMVQNTFSKIDSLDQDILAVMSSEEEHDTELTTVTEYEEKYRMAKVKADNFLEDKADCSGDSSGNTSSTKSRGTASKRTYKLPKIEIRKFGGDLKDWLPFWSQFDKIHNDKTLHESDKFQYLVQSMVLGSRAQKLVSSYPQSAANYQKVVGALKDRFGDQVLLTEVYVRQLLKLVIRNVGKTRAVTLSNMYDELESHLRALESLGVTQEQSAAFLYPMVESSLPEETIKAWQRSSMSGYDDDQPGKPVDERLTSLMKFLRMEVKGAERLSYVSEGFDEPVKEKQVKDKKSTSVPATAAGLLAGQRAACIFCDKLHDSQVCITAQTMPYGLKQRKIMAKRACLSCLKVGHVAKSCQTYVKCMICQKRHITLMCPNLEANKKHEDNTKSVGSKVDQIPMVQSQLNCTSEVLLQTLRCVIRNGDKQKQVRVLLDPGSQNSYLLESTARQLGLKSSGEVQLCHLLFGGQKEVQQHSLYEIEIEGTNNSCHSQVRVLGHKRICSGIPKMSRGPWMAELKLQKIFVSDLAEDQNEIELLIGSDHYAKWLTGRKHCLANGLVALETCFGWTLSGKLSQTGEDKPDEACAMLVTSMFVAEASVAELWKLEAIGIHDPAEHKTHEEKQASVKEHFLRTVTRSEDGRYSVSLPWTVTCPELPDNREVAERRLVSLTAKLQSRGQYQEYQKVFDDWLTEGIIETVNDDGDKKQHCHYLPHRAVFKPESLTTPVRPVFDASCKVGRAPSLNQVLEKGPNLVELLPAVLLRFRENKIGVTADIRKAFQMIAVEEADRDFLRFLWCESPDTTEFKVFRHKRVVFGVNCSPFLLAAVLELHLKSVSCEEAVVADKLLKSLYVDNCVTSVATYDEYEQFRRQAIEIMANAKMDLRGWECSQPAEDSTELGNSTESQQTAKMVSDLKEDETSVKVLGLVWNKAKDTLSCDVPSLEPNGSTTKRTVLSCLSKIFDPVGFLCPAMLPLKLLLQSAWLANLGWDEQLPEEAVNKFKKWHAESLYLLHVSVSRDITGGRRSQESEFQLHTFCDASQDAYATVVYLRAVDEANRVSVQMLMARSRLAPVKRPTIPRLELLACLIGARLTSFVKEALDLPSIPTFLWSDSTTALSWIKGNDEWGTFVGNRVREIGSLSKPEDWRHVPGASNPADLPSRGCSPSQLYESRWWEGPRWLYKSADDWPVEEVILDETAILAERKVSGSVKESSVKVNFQRLKLGDSSEHTVSVTLLAGHVTKADDEMHPWYLVSSSYAKNIRVVAWIRRFICNSRPSESKQTGTLTIQEFLEAESVVLRCVQSEEFPEQSEAIRGLVVARASDGLYHVKTRLTFAGEATEFSFPVLLPSGHPLVILLIRWYHVKHHHAGTQFLMSRLREKFWILQARRTINRVIHKCPTCLRHSSKSFQVDPATLPAARTEAAHAFQTTGVDLAGPLYLKSGEKAWLVLFTCAVYRCVHLDFVTSLSTEVFLNALERFINTRGRPITIYSDNGSNFVGLVNMFKKVDWQIVAETASVRQIKWIFNPPSAAWWGGWWERLIRTVKDLLKRMLGNARLNYDQLRTNLSHVENLINERPLTIVTEDPSDLIPLTPAMFLRGLSSGAFPEGKQLAVGLQAEYKKRQSLQRELTVRFRNEYLSQLVQRANEKPRKRPQVGDMVLVGADDQRRIHWPMARIVELIPGRDGAVRVARVKTQHGTLLRPLQRLYPLEVSVAESDRIVDALPQGNASSTHLLPAAQQPAARLPVPEHSDVVTRSGRRVHKPKKLVD